jgi:serine/threonine protein kinase
VYLARQCTVGRNVALKILPPVTPANLREILRFLREAKTAGAVDHPSIVTVLAAGIQTRHPYIAMRYVDGETLAEKIRRARDSTLRGSFGSIFRLAESGNSDALPKEPLERRLETGAGPTSPRDMQRLVAFFEKAARALHEAHKAGLIHRDIKPGNIMVNAEGEPVILDFGLAQEAAQVQTITRTGELAGTPPYMSPEQISSRIRLDARTDIYSLAVTLYECLTLERPFKAEPRDALYQEILAKPPPNARMSNPHISRDLRVVLEKALAKDRDLRYGTALEFAEDLRRVRKHRAIHARAPGVHRRLWQAVRLLPLHAWVVGAILVALVALQVFTALRLAEELKTPESSRNSTDPPSGRE